MFARPRQADLARRRRVPGRRRRRGPAAPLGRGRQDRRVRRRARRRSTRADVEEVASTTAKTSVFELGTALGNRDCAAALRLLNRLVGEGESVFGLHALALRTGPRPDRRRARCIDRGERLAGRARARAGQAGLAGASNLAAAGAALLGRRSWSTLLRAAAASEAEMKTSRDPRLVFERWIVKVCG